MCSFQGFEQVHVNRRTGLPLIVDAAGYPRAVDNVEPTYKYEFRKHYGVEHRPLQLAMLPYVSLNAQIFSVSTRVLTPPYLSGCVEAPKMSHMQNPLNQLSIDTQISPDYDGLAYEG